MTVKFFRSTDPGAPQLPANSGTLTAIFDACLLSAGWTKEYSQTNLRSAYKQGANGTKFFYLDDGSGTTVRARLYSSMTGIDAGVGPCPTDAQSLGGNYVHKHDGQAGTRGWVLVANERSFWFVTQMTAAANWDNGSAMFFGDIVSLKAGDEYATMLMGARAAAHPPNPPSDEYVYNITTTAGLGTRVDTTIPAHFIERAWHGVGGSVPIGKHMDCSRAEQTMLYRLYQYGHFRIGGSNSLAFPNRTDNSLLLSPVYIHELGTVRGRMPGIMTHPHHQGIMMPGDLVPGTGDFAGRVFMFVNHWYASFFLEVSDTW